MCFFVRETTGHRALERMRATMRECSQGLQILSERPRITDATLAACWEMPSGSLGAAYAASPALANTSVRVIATALVDGTTGANLTIALSAPINSADNLPRRRSLKGDDHNDNGGSAASGARVLSTNCLSLLAQVVVASKSQSIPPPGLAALTVASRVILTSPSTISALSSALAPVESR